jgi:hypothetical protein
VPAGAVHLASGARQIVRGGRRRADISALWRASAKSGSPARNGGAGPWRVSIVYGVSTVACQDTRFTLGLSRRAENKKRVGCRLLGCTS